MSNIFKSGGPKNNRFSFGDEWKTENSGPNKRKENEKKEKREYNKKPDHKEKSGNDKYNSFSSQETKKPVFFSVENDFPELGKKVDSKKEEVIKLDNKKFSDIIKKDIEIEEKSKEKKIILEEGWVSYTRENGNQIRIDYGPNTKPKIETSKVEGFPLPTPQETILKAIEIILENREKFKANFLELQGEHEYERIYGKDVHYDEEEEEVEEEEEGEYYDYYGDDIF
jgi:hypothetical protein